MNSLLLTHERVDDVPLLLGLAEQLHFPEIFDRHLGRHGLHEGLSPGQLATGWIAYILSQGDHTKLHVRDWAAGLTHTLGHFFAQPLRDTDFTDDRLGIVLRRLAEADWPALEADLFTATCEVHELPTASIRLDSTTASGYHAVQPAGLMQFGSSKDHRPDLPQLKLMAAACEPAGQLLASSVHPGCAADDPLYAPLIERIDAMLGKKGLLFTGDCKMTALQTRALIASKGHFYLGTLARNGQNAALIDGWVEELLADPSRRQPLYDGERYLGLGGEWRRRQSDGVKGQAVSWRERVQLLRPEELFQRQQRQLAERLSEAEQALWRLTPPPGVGQKQIRDEQVMAQRVQAVLDRHGVASLLQVDWQRQEQRQVKQIGPGRRTAQRPTREVVKVRYQLTAVRRDEEAIGRHIERLAWRVQVTNLPKKRLGLPGCVLGYRQGWCLEQDFHLVKSKPLGLRPMFVWKDEQLQGLTRLLTIALRLLTLLQLRVRAKVAEEGQPLQGTYAAQAGRKDAKPTALRLLASVARAQITLSRGQDKGKETWSLSAEPEILKKLLRWLDLPGGLYSDLARQPATDPITSTEKHTDNSS